MSPLSSGRRGRARWPLRCGLLQPLRRCAAQRLLLVLLLLLLPPLLQQRKTLRLFLQTRLSRCSRRSIASVLLCYYVTRTSSHVTLRHPDAPSAGKLRAWGTAKGVRFFLICFVDLFGVPRSKLVPTASIDEFERTGASFAAFATYIVSSAAEPDTFARPDAACAVILPWNKEVAWVPADIFCRGKPIAHAPRNVLKAQIAAAAKAGVVVKSGVEVEFFLLTPDGTGPARLGGKRREIATPFLLYNLSIHAGSPRRRTGTTRPSNPRTTSRRAPTGLFPLFLIVKL